MSLTSLLYSGVADLVLGAGVFTALACTVGAAMIFDSWLDARKDTHYGSR